MSVPLVCHLHQLSTYITGPVTGNRNFNPSSLRTNLLLEKECIADLVPFMHVSSARINHKQMLSFFSPGTPQPKKKKYREDLVTVHKIKPKIITSYSKLICSIDSSDMMLNTLG
jgi:hypothetical protein